MKSLPFPPIGLYEKALPADFPLEDKIKQAKSAGFDFMELSIDESPEFLSRLDCPTSERSKIRRFTQQNDLPLFSLCLSAQRRFPLGSADPAIRTKSKEILAKAIQLASDLAIRVILISGYWVFYEPVLPSSEDYFIEGLAWGARLAARSGVMLGIENIDSHAQINSIRQIMKVIRIIDSPWLKIYGDFANLAAFGFNVSAELAVGQGHIVAIHVKDAVQNEVRGIPLGQGIVDFPAAFNQLADINYSGPFLLEMWSQTGQDAFTSASHALQTTRNYLSASAYGTADPNN
jgi:predicted hexulose-6-phosphate isomerase